MNQKPRGIGGVNAFNPRAHYEAAESSRLRKSIPIDPSAADYENLYAGITLAHKARYLDANDGIATGIFDNKRAAIVGKGTITEPLVKRLDGTPATEFNAAIRAAWREWNKKPDVTSIHTGAQLQRLACLSTCRDGEIFGRFHEGYAYQHHTRFPLSIELIERDQLPAHFNDAGQNIVQGIQKNAQGVPIIYYFYKHHPGNYQQLSTELVPVPASNVFHHKYVRRINQTRGISHLHSAMNLLADINETNKYELTTAKMAATIGLSIERPLDFKVIRDPRTQEVLNTRGAIEQMFPGMILDGLEPGEKASMLSPNNRPNPNMIGFLDSQKETVAAAVSLSPSTVKKKYTGSYSAERQGLVEAQRLLEMFIDDFQSDYMQPIYERFLLVCITYGFLKLPKDIDLNSLYDTTHRAPKMPWIDPGREITAMKDAVEAGFDSRTNTIRGMGRTFDEVQHELITETKSDQEAGLSFTTSADGIPGGVPQQANLAPAKQGSQVTEQDNDDE